MCQIQSRVLLFDIWCSERQAATVRVGMPQAQQRHLHEHQRSSRAKPHSRSWRRSQPQAGITLWQFPGLLWCFSQMQKSWCRGTPRSTKKLDLQPGKSHLNCPMGHCEYYGKDIKIWPLVWKYLVDTSIMKSRVMAPESSIPQSSICRN